MTRTGQLDLRTWPDVRDTTRSGRLETLKQDVIIVGAGTAGSTAARFLAQSGFSVSLVDLKEREAIGEKVCGDAIAKHHFDRVGLDYPQGDELLSHVNGLAVYSPDRESVLRVQGEGVTGFMVDRHGFGQRLLGRALDAGATLLDHRRALEPIVRKNTVVGVRLEDVHSSSVVEMEAPITIDASGYVAVLRSKIPTEMGVEPKLRAEDSILAYREIRADVEFTSDLSEIHVTQKEAPGGYYWIFDRGRGEVNVGLGVQMRAGCPNPKEQLYKHVLSQKLFRNSKIVRGGGGIVPTRRPLPSLTANGIIFIGDAACLVNPIHGGGIGPSMTSGKIAAETTAKALGEGNVSREGLWSANVSYMKTYGGKQAGLDVFRMFLQSISDEELNFGLKHQLVTHQDVLGASMEGELDYSIAEKAERVLRGIGKLSLLYRLKKTADLMRTAKQLYMDYPSPEGYASWRSKADSMFSHSTS
ncbi:MAG: NAD(P)/FAD-dependent oxidoreductase [archaeon]